MNQTPLEIALDLSLESKGMPFGPRKYFHELVMEDYLQARSFSSTLESTLGRNIPDDRKLLRKDRTPERLDLLKKVSRLLGDLTHKNQYPEDAADGHSLIESKTREASGIWTVQYEVRPTQAQYVALQDIHSAEESTRFVDTAIESGEFEEEDILIGTKGYEDLVVFGVLPSGVYFLQRATEDYIYEHHFESLMTAPQDPRVITNRIMEFIRTFIPPTIKEKKK